MSKAYVFYNPIAGNFSCKDKALSIKKLVDDEVVFCDMTNEEEYRRGLMAPEGNDYIIVCGGDGTLNRFVNFTADMDIRCDVYYYPLGSGNDFAHEMNKTSEDKPFLINEYIKDLPTVTVNGKNYRFLNGIGYGIDGYCCEVGDKLRETSSGKQINYTSIAIKGLLFHYKPTDAVITVDGKKYEYKKVWLAPTMNGRFYGGGMIPTPAQKRNSGTLSTLVFHGSGKLRTLMIFPSIFKGEHINNPKYVEVLEGKNITVEFKRPTALQIDGETILGVTSYSASAYSKVPATV